MWMETIRCICNCDYEHSEYFWLFYAEMVSVGLHYTTNTAMISKLFAQSATGAHTTPTQYTHTHELHIFIDCIWTWLWTFQLKTIHNAHAIARTFATHIQSSAHISTFPLYAWMNTNLRANNDHSAKEKKTFLNMCESICGRFTVFSLPVIGRNVARALCCC